jgi:hypothetical protein
MSTKAPGPTTALLQSIPAKIQIASPPFHICEMLNGLAVLSVLFRGKTMPRTY